MKRVILSVFTSTIVLYSLVVFKFNSEPVINSGTGFSTQRLCIIDAGHGGFDGGASGFDGTLEKDLNLSMAQKLNDILLLNGYDTIMIREDDISVEEPFDTHKKKGDMRKRLKTARENPEALFISIHQNSFKQSKSKGLQVFYGVKNPKSRLLASKIQSSVKEDFQKDNRRTIKAAEDNLYLLYNMENVCVMAECGFMSNKEELRLLKDDAYQQELMLRVFRGIEKYYEEEGSSDG